MKKYSRVVKVDGKRFRYNFDDCLVEYIYTDKETKETEVIESIGLRKENWTNKEIREEYLSEWAFELQCEIDDLVEMATRDFERGIL